MLMTDLVQQRTLLWYTTDTEEHLVSEQNLTSKK